jgi:hypothetical protein
LLSLPATSSTRSIGFNTLIVAFAGHLIAWTGYVAIHISDESFYLPQPWVISLSGFLLAVVAAFCAVIIGQALPRRFRPWFMIISLIVLIGSGISEIVGLVFYSIDTPLNGVVDIVANSLAVLPFIGELAYPFVLSGVIVWAVRVASTELQTTPRTRIVSGRGDPGFATTAFVIYALTLVIGIAVAMFLIVTFFAPVASISDEGWDTEFIWLTAAGIVGAIGLTGVLRRLSTTPMSTTVSTTLATLSLFALVFAHQLSSLSVAQAVYYDSTGIGGTLVWVFAAFMFPLTAVLFLLMALIIKIRSRHGWTRTSSGHL